MTWARNFFRVISVIFGALGGSFFRALDGFAKWGGVSQNGGGIHFSNSRVVLDVQIYIRVLLWTITAHLTSAEIIIGNSNKHYQRTNVKLVVSKVQIQPSLQVGYCRCPVGFSFGLIDLEYFSFPHVVRVLWWIQGEYWAVCRVFGTFQSKCEFPFFPPCF